MSVSTQLYSGTYRGTVCRNNDPFLQARATLKVPEVLGNSESAWAVPSSPTTTVPGVGIQVWVTFAGGDIRTPVYTAHGLKELATSVDVLTDTLPPKQPSGLALSSTFVAAQDGGVTARLQAQWVPPTQNQDGTPLTDLAGYEAAMTYDDGSNPATVWGGSVTTSVDLLTWSNVLPGVNVWTRVRALDTNGNPSLWTVASTVTVSASSPLEAPSTPLAVGVLGGIKVTWDGADDQGNQQAPTFDHIQVVRDTDVNFSNPTVVCTMRSAGSFYDAGVGYVNSYNYELIAVSNTNILSTPSTSVNATAVQAGTDDLAVNSVTADQLSAGSVDAVSLAADIVLAGKISTALSGRRTEIDNDNGIVVYETDGSILVQFPNDPLQSAAFNGDLTAQSLTVQGNMSIQGITNQISQNSSVVLLTGLSAPTTPPSAVVDYPQVYCGVATYQNRVGWCSLGSNYWSTYPSANANVVYLQQYNADGSYNHALTVTLSNSFGTAANGSTVRQHGGITAIGNVLYALVWWPGWTAPKGSTQQSIPGGYYVFAVNATTGAVIDYGLIYWSTSYRRPAIGTDGSNLIVAQTGSGNVYFYAYSPPTGGIMAGRQLSTTSGTTLPTSGVTALNDDLIYVGKQNYDFGGNYVVVAGENTPSILVLTNNNTLYPGYSFALADVSSVGFTWNGTAFTSLSQSSPTLTIYTGLTWTTSDPSTWWLSITYTDSNPGGTGVHETSQSVRSHFTMKKRARLTVAIPDDPVRPNPTTPDDPTGVNLYIGRGNTDPGFLAMERQPVFPDGTASVQYTTFVLAPTGGAAVQPPPATTNFPNAVPGKIVSNDSTSLVINGDGSARMGQMSVDPPIAGARGVVNIPNRLPIAIAAGTLMVQPSAAGVPTAATVTLPAGVFTVPPILSATLYTRAAGTDVTGLGVWPINASSFSVYVTRNNTIGTTISWQAVQLS